MNIGFPTDMAAFEFFARFVLSGFVIYLVRNAYVVGERPKIADIALDIALYSLVNQLVFRLFGWIGGLVLAIVARISTAPEGLPDMIPGTNLMFYIEVLALPVTIGVLTGLSLREGWLHGPYRALSIPLVDPLPAPMIMSSRGRPRLS